MSKMKIKLHESHSTVPEDSLTEFQRVVNEFIGNNGGWDYFPID